MATDRTIEAGRARKGVEFARQVPKETYPLFETGEIVFDKVVHGGVVRLK